MGIKKVAPYLLALSLGSQACATTEQTNAYYRSERAAFGKKVEGVLNVATLEQAKKLTSDHVARNDMELMLQNPFIVQALAYPDSFFKTLPDPLPPTTDAVSHAWTLLSQDPTWKQRFVAELEKRCADHGILTPQFWQIPVVGGQYNGRDGTNHDDALDIFIPEGSPVHSIADGLVILAENGWKAEEALSTSTGNGGNTVIIYHPGIRRFIRYAHFEKVLVSSGTRVNRGDQIGIVGHSGRNASLPGRGNHVHFEVNVFDSRTNQVVTLTASQLHGFLRQIEGQR